MRYFQILFVVSKLEEIAKLILNMDSASSVNMQTIDNSPFAGQPVPA